MAIPFAVLMVSSCALLVPAAVAKLGVWLNAPGSAGIAKPPWNPGQTYVTLPRARISAIVLGIQYHRMWYAWNELGRYDIEIFQPRQRH
jgi:hypothetical protein